MQISTIRALIALSPFALSPFALRPFRSFSPANHYRPNWGHTLRTKIKDFKVSSFICNSTAYDRPGAWRKARTRASCHIRQLPQCWSARMPYHKLAHKFYMEKFRYNTSPERLVCTIFQRVKLGHYPGSGWSLCAQSKPKRRVFDIGLISATLASARPFCLVFIN